MSDGRMYRLAAAVVMALTLTTAPLHAECAETLHKYGETARLMGVEERSTSIPVVGFNGIRATLGTVEGVLQIGWYMLEDGVVVQVTCGIVLRV